MSALNIFAIATADASDPPLPIVVISPFFEIPWKPGNIATPFSSKYLLIFSTLIFTILASIFYFKEKIIKTEILGILITLTGILIILFNIW